MTGEPQTSYTLNSPRLVTVSIALLLTVLGLMGTILPIPPVLAFFADTGYPLTREWAHFFLAASPVLLMIGNLFRSV